MGVMQIESFAEAGPARRMAWSRPSGRRALRLHENPQPAAALPQASYSSPRPSLPVLVGIVALHLVAIAVLATMKYQAGMGPDRPRVATFSIEEPPPPAPAEPAPPETPVAAPVMVPVAMPDPPIRLPQSVELAASPPAPVVAPVSRVAPSVSPPAAPPPRVAAPAPIIPPDFNAGQLDNPAPAYPYLSKRAREEGVVLLRVLVSPQGVASRLEIEESSGFGRLDDAALKTVRDWRFVPATQAGNPVQAWVLVPVTFSLS